MFKVSDWKFPRIVWYSRAKCIDQGSLRDTDTPGETSPANSSISPNYGLSKASRCPHVYSLKNTYPTPKQLTLWLKLTTTILFHLVSIQTEL